MRTRILSGIVVLAMLALPPLLRAAEAPVFMEGFDPLASPH